MKVKLLVGLVISGLSFYGVYSLAQYGNPSTSTDANKSQNTTTSSNPAGSTDQDITDAVNSRISQDTALSGTHITASSNNGVITLNGDVTSQSQADEAVSIARNTSGVKDVTNNIKVNPAAS